MFVCVYVCVPLCVCVRAHVYVCVCVHAPAHGKWVSYCDGVIFPHQVAAVASRWEATQQ